MNKKIEVLIESDEGHTTKLIPEDNVPKEVSDELKKDQWATIKKKDGTTNVLTKADTPKEEDWKTSFAKAKPKTDTSIPKSTVDNFKNKFQDVESVMITKRAKGG